MTLDKQLTLPYRRRNSTEVTRVTRGLTGHSGLCCCYKVLHLQDKQINHNCPFFVTARGMKLQVFHDAVSESCELWDAGENHYLQKSNLNVSALLTKGYCSVWESAACRSHSWKKTHLKEAKSTRQVRACLGKGMCREKGTNTCSRWVWGNRP